MASSKRSRQRQNAALNVQEEQRAPKHEKARQTSQQRAWSERVHRLFDADSAAYKNKDRIQTATGLIVAATFYYGLVAKQGAIIETIGIKEGLRTSPSPVPTFRHILPEPLDAMAHMSNAYWTKLLMDVRMPFTQTRMRDATFGINQIDHRLYGLPEPNIAERAIKAGAIGTALHVGIEAISAGMPGLAGELMGGFDPIDVAYGGAAAVIIAGYDMHKRRSAINQADTTPTTA